MMTEADWLQLAHKEVMFLPGRSNSAVLGKLLGCGGAGAVYDMGVIGGNEWVIKVLDPESPVARQEERSLGDFRARSRYNIGLMKMRSPQGKFSFEGKIFKYYLMRKGCSLKDAVEYREKWLQDQNSVLRLAAYLVSGINSLKNMGLSHGDIKADNILLVKYMNVFYPMLADYGTVSDSKVPFRTLRHTCQAAEYESVLEERIAYDLYCLYQVFCHIYGVEDDVLSPETVPHAKVRRILRIMRDDSEKAFERLEYLVISLEGNINIPVAFYLDEVPEFDMSDYFPYKEVKKWRNKIILRDRNTALGGKFDPLLLLNIPDGHYEKVCRILNEYNSLEDFVMPIARYADNGNNQYVLLHAPDDRQKCICKQTIKDRHDVLIQDADGEPYTLIWAAPEVIEREMSFYARLLRGENISIAFAPENIWHLDGRWKLNLFEVQLPEQI